VTVDKAFIGASSESFPATYQRTGYVAVTRGKEQVQIFTDDRQELLKAVSRPDEPLSATELSRAAELRPKEGNQRLKGLTKARARAQFGSGQQIVQAGIAQEAAAQRGLDHDR
jgi:hypothetical protein